ncbi:MAG: Rrf2 family transcriptional regulator [Lachnospiraceae bacterium]|nr:Rrf2 family transcriptional regulator [Lachnospiraceae bacterium]MDD3794756.1 Rrf2 family transcriptional regulator [Lachnospiraceae bacterium]
MRLSSRCSVALHCLIVIADAQDQTKVTSELLARSTGCNAAAIRSILNSLKKCGIIDIKRGVGGAYLKQTPTKITIWSVYHALEPDGLAHFIGLHPNPSEYCPVGRQIYAILEKPYSDIGETIQKEMERITLQQLLDEHDAEG